MRTLVIVAALVLGACGDNGRQPARGDRIFDTQRQALDRAKQAEEQLKQTDQQRRAAEDAQAQ